MQNADQETTSGPVEGDPVTVSVVIPTFNREDTLPKALGSVFAQREPGLEVIVVDDASTQDIRSVVEGMEGPRVRYHRLEERSGPAITRNVAIRMARGPLIAFLDSDDEWLPGKLERQLPLFGPDLDAVDAVYSGYRIVHQDGHSEAIRRPLPRSMRRKLMGGNAFGCTSSVIARKAALVELGGFNERLPAFVDYDLWFRMALAGMRFASVPDPLVRFQKGRPDRVSASVERRIRAQEIFLRDHLESGELRPLERRRFIAGQLTQRGQEIASAGRTREGVSTVVKGLTRWPFNPWSWYHLLRTVRGALGGSNRGL